MWMCMKLLFNINQNKNFTHTHTHIYIYINIGWLSKIGQFRVFKKIIISNFVKLENCFKYI